MVKRFSWTAANEQRKNSVVARHSTANMPKPEDSSPFLLKDSQQKRAQINNQAPGVKAARSAKLRAKSRKPTLPPIKFGEIDPKP